MPRKGESARILFWLRKKKKKETAGKIAIGGPGKEGGDAFPSPKLGSSHLKGLLHSQRAAGAFTWESKEEKMKLSSSTAGRDNHYH